MTFILALVLVSCKDQTTEPEPGSIDDELIDILETNSTFGLEDFILPSSDNFAAIPQDPKNPLTTEKVALGKLLYHETALGINPLNSVSYKTYSCASCHAAGAGFQAAVRQGIGDGGEGFGASGEGRTRNAGCPEKELDVQPLRSPSSMNTAYQEVMLWNGQFGATGVNQGTESKWNAGGPLAVNNLGYQGLETQAIAGFAVHRMGVDMDVLAVEPYKSMFASAFPDVPEQDRYSSQMIGLAMAAYERTLLSNEAPFQQWLKGDLSALTRNQKEGAVLFFGKAGCVKCHSGPALNSMEFYALGFNDLVGGDIFQSNPNDNAHLGRGGYTGNAAENYQFKVPQLYNMRDSRFYGHGGSMIEIEDVVRYKNEAVSENRKVPASQLALSFVPLGLTEAEIESITDFLENGLYDANLMRYEPLNLPSGLCFPNNDSLSKADRGCL